MHETLIQPHGGELVDCKLYGTERQSVLEKAQDLPRLSLSLRNLADLECIATGIYSPLTGFVDEEDYYSIVNSMHLSNGLAWTVPVTLQVPAFDDKYSLDTEVALHHPNGEILAVMTVTSKFKPDQNQEAAAVYRTTEHAHPGVKAMWERGEVYLGGEIKLVNDIPQKDFLKYRFTPVDTRTEFTRRQWTTVVAFQTRNPIHRAHEYITKVALETVDGLFINPLVGTTKGDDIPADVRIHCYELVIENYYPRERVFFGVFPAAMRYAGPREAVMHAIARQNYGCSHFIVGRDHAGVGNYYGTYDAQQIFREFGKEELSINIMKFEHSFYCQKCGAMGSAKTCPHPEADHVFLSGTKVRQMLSRGEMPPEQFSRPEVARALVEAQSDKSTTS